MIWMVILFWLVIKILWKGQWEWELFDLNKWLVIFNFFFVIDQDGCYCFFDVGYYVGKGFYCFDYVDDLVDFDGVVNGNKGWVLG